MKNVLKLLSCIAISACNAACTAPQQAQVITLAAEALPCYTAVAAATTTPSGQSNATKALNAANVLATNPICVQLDTGSVSLISSLVTSGTTPAVAPAATSTPTVLAP